MRNKNKAQARRKRYEKARNVLRNNQPDYFKKYRAVKSQTEADAVCSRIEKNKERMKENEKKLTRHRIALGKRLKDIVATGGNGK